MGSYDKKVIRGVEGSDPLILMYAPWPSLSIFTTWIFSLGIVFVIDCQSIFEMKLRLICTSLPFFISVTLFCLFKGIKGDRVKVFKHKPVNLSIVNNSYFTSIYTMDMFWQHLKRMISHDLSQESDIIILGSFLLHQSLKKAYPLMRFLVPPPSWPPDHLGKNH